MNEPDKDDDNLKSPAWTEGDSRAEDEVLHVTISEVPHKCMRQERRALKDLEVQVLEKIPVSADIRSLTHRDIITELACLMKDVPNDGLSEKVFGNKRDDGTEVWKEMIEGRGFVIVLAQVPGVTETQLALGRLHVPLNLSAGTSDKTVRFVGLVVGPPNADVLQTRTSFETGRTLASILSEATFRLKADGASTDSALHEEIHSFLEETKKHAHHSQPLPSTQEDIPLCTTPFSGLIDDVKRKAKWWASDFYEAKEYPARVLSTSVYLFCIILAPAIAFGKLMSDKTENEIGPMEILISQSISGLVFSIFGGCPFVIIMTTGPLTIFIGFLHELSGWLDTDFLPFYAWVGVWNSIWLLLSVAFNLSNHIHYVTAYVDQIFACLVAGIFAYEAIKPTATDFFTPLSGQEAAGCMGVILVFGTFFLAVQFLELRASQKFTQSVRVVISDYGTAIAVLIMSGIYHIAKVDHVETLNVPNTVELSDPKRSLFVDMGKTETHIIFIAAGPAFLLFMLFFLDENITSILSNKKEFKLRKGEAMHLDLFVVAIINLLLGMMGLPFLHGALPQSPLHVVQLADHEEYTERGVLIRRVVKSRETRVTSFLCHILMAAATIGALPALKALPVPVLYGVFLTMAYQGAKDNPFVERLLLWMTELSKYVFLSFRKKKKKKNSGS